MHREGTTSPDFGTPVSRHSAPRPADRPSSSASCTRRATRGGRRRHTARRRITARRPSGAASQGCRPGRSLRRRGTAATDPPGRPRRRTAPDARAGPVAGLGTPAADRHSASRGVQVRARPLRRPPGAVPRSGQPVSGTSSGPPSVPPPWPSPWPGSGRSACGRCRPGQGERQRWGVPPTPLQRSQMGVLGDVVHRGGGQVAAVHGVQRHERHPQPGEFAAPHVLPNGEPPLEPVQRAQQGGQRGAACR